MSKFIIQVNGSVYGDNAGYHALKFVEAVLSAGHDIVRVFFYQEGVSHANLLLSPASDELNLHRQWCALADKHSIQLVNCASAALRRGILSQQEAAAQQFAHWNTQKPFINGGLGELVTGIEQADRLVVF